MVARIQQGPGDLVITFSRRGSPPESILCTNGETAADHAFHLLAKHRPLLAGDLLFVRRDAEVGSVWPDDGFGDVEGAP